MTPSEIKTGMKFGHWEVIKFDHTNEHRVKYFLCKCDVCGTYRPVRATSLISGQSTACSQACKKEIVGQKFGRWTVKTKDESRPRYYICECECGTKKSVYGGSLTTGKSLSCGCLKIEHTKQKNEENAKNHIGEKYGKLTIYDYELRPNEYWYKCHCDCGNDTIVAGKRLFIGMTSSCGCLNSKANELMDKFLTSKNIPFKREYKFEDCRDKNPLPFDFAIFNKEKELIGLMELNGSLHYSASGTGWDTPERLIRQQKHDYIKRLFCEQNKIPFLVIPYQYFNDMEKFLTTSDFWQIIIKNFND